MDSSETAFNKWEKESAINCCSIDRQKTTDTAENVHVVMKDMAHRWHSQPQKKNVRYVESWEIINNIERRWNVFSFFGTQFSLHFYFDASANFTRKRKIGRELLVFCGNNDFSLIALFRKKNMKKDYNNFHSFDIFLITSRMI